MRIAQVGEQAIATSIVVAAELRFGAAKTGSLRLATRVDGILARLVVL
jgi:tRNA(fMet)-specific endonuclease VapC